MTPPDVFGDLEALTVELAEILPHDDVTQLAHACRAGRAGLHKFEAHTAGISVRAASRQLRAHLADDRDSDYAAGLLLGAARARLQLRDDQHTDVVWTGPASGIHTSRLTSAVISELVDSAEHELLLVSYATFPPASLTTSLQAAVARGVDVTLLLEQPATNPNYRGSTGFPALLATRLIWPSDARESGASLHAKIIVVDRKVALVGSANLTSHAFEKNLECGILLRDAAHARAIAIHLDSLREAGTLRRTTG